jgi:hypothetical protein
VSATGSFAALRRRHFKKQKSSKTRSINLPAVSPVYHNLSLLSMMPISKQLMDLPDRERTEPESDFRLFA